MSKRYVLSHQTGYKTLRDVLTPRALVSRLFTRDPATHEDFWALRDVTFDVSPGEAVGIIGRNGAGKSTLLKILSRIASPTDGEIRLRGRVASLLEVGTGFHPELTGRENIFLNGAILGMSRGDVARKFDAIVDFSGVERFLDTPVKRYSSGMYVRLAFAVAAQLEPDILVVDEVLAVGDAEFQRKCLGKMQDVATDQGRTILFVSHNLTAVQSLCKRAVWLEGGRVVDVGEAPRIVTEYLNKGTAPCLERVWTEQDAPQSEADVRLVRVAIETPPNVGALDVFTPFTVSIDFDNRVDGQMLHGTIQIDSVGGEVVFDVGCEDVRYSVGRHRVTCAIPGSLMNDGLYTLTPKLIVDGARLATESRDALTFEIHDGPRSSAWFGKWRGAVRPNFLEWTSSPINPDGGAKTPDKPGAGPRVLASWQ
ncbi:MAG: polysaccharide ABC transporter ATP-binding protein [Polyangiales bacterium]